MTFSEENYRFMFAALQEAEKAVEENEVPVGAVIVHKNRIIGKGRNQNIKLNDPTAHAEMIAITSAANFLNTQVLSDCDLYVTLEPCPMCAGAILLSRVKNLWISIQDPKMGACGTVYNIINKKLLINSNSVFYGIYENESKALLKNFFNNLRKVKN